MFDYQSVRHCSKTSVAVFHALNGLITSQFDTAPKLKGFKRFSNECLITSQFDTAPKLDGESARGTVGLITSQFDTAPKLQRVVVRRHLV